MAAQPMRIFSYLPNPRIWKAQIAAAYLNVELEIVGDRPGELTDWLWDVNPRPLADGERDSLADNAVTGSRGFSNSLIKTDAFYSNTPSAQYQRHSSAIKEWASLSRIRYYAPP